ncbi:MAG: hypothetical protein RXP99_05380 [Vulcanisaeta sp.]
MPFIAEPFRALLTDVVTPKYVYSLMESLRCGLPSDGEFPVMTIGTGAKTVVIITGFSVLDYRISNTLVYMIASKCVGDVYVIPTFSIPQLSRWTIKVVPMANPWPFNSWEVIRNRERFYHLDGDGIPVRYDALTLRSKYSVKLHSLINDVKPQLVITLTTSNEWSVMAPRPVSIDGYKQVELGPFDFLSHFAYEGYPTVIMTIPRESETHEIAHRVVQLIRDYEVKHEASRSLEVVVRASGDVNNITNILRFHELNVEVDGDKLIIKANERSQPLLNSLIDNNLIEHYFNVEILEVHPQ